MLLKAKLYVEKRSKMILLMKESREEEGKERIEMDVGYVLRRKGAWQKINSDLQQKCA